MKTSLLSRMLWICFIAISLQLPLHAANLPDWVRTARIANAEPDVEADEAELNAIIALRKSENVSVLELDPDFSEYHTDAQFTARIKSLERRILSIGLVQSLLMIQKTYTSNIPIMAYIAWMKMKCGVHKYT